MDLDAALEETDAITRRYYLWRTFHRLPAYSGGVLDAWPRAVVEGFAICQAEEQAVDAFERSVRE